MELRALGLKRGHATEKREGFACERAMLHGPATTHKTIERANGGFAPIGRGRRICFVRVVDDLACKDMCVCGGQLRGGLVWDFFLAVGCCLDLSFFFF